MEAIVLAGGLGSRLQEIVSDVPKPMAPVAGRPFLEFLLSFLSRRGFQRVVLSVGHLANAITRHFGSTYQGMDITYETETVPLGTGGATRAALERCTEDHVFVFNGDTYLDLETDEVDALWRTTREQIIVARQVPDTARFGRLEIRGDRALAFGEKGASGPGFINAGTYVMSRDALEGFPAGTAFSLERDHLAVAAMSKGLRTFVTRGFFIDIGVPDDYRRAQLIFSGAPE